MPKYDDVVPALKWRLNHLPKTTTAEQLASALDIEELPYDQIPEQHWSSVHAFRRLRNDARVRVASRYLKEMEDSILKPEQLFHHKTNAETQLENATDSLERIKRHALALEGQLTLVRKERDQLGVDYMKANEESSRGWSRARALTTEVNRLMAKCSELSDAARKAEAAAESHKKNWEASTSHCAQLAAEVDRLKAASQSTPTFIEDALKDARDRLSEKANRCLKLAEQNADLEKKLKAERDSSKETARKLREAEGRILRLKADFEELYCKSQALVESRQNTEDALKVAQADLDAERKRTSVTAHNVAAHLKQCAAAGTNCPCVDVCQFASRDWVCINQHGASVYDGLYENEAALIAKQHGLLKLRQ